MYSSSLSRSSAPRSERSDLGLVANVVEDAAAVFEAAHLGLDFVGAGRRETAGRTPSTARWPPARARRSASRRGRRLRRTGPGWGSASGRRCARPRTGRARSRCESRAGPRPARRSGNWPRPGARSPGLMPACDKPETTVKSLAEVLEHFQVRREFVVLACPSPGRSRADASRAACRCRPCAACGVARRRPCASAERRRRARQGQRDAGGTEEVCGGAVRHGTRSSVTVQRLACTAPSLASETPCSARSHARAIGIRNSWRECLATIASISGLSAVVGAPPVA